MEQNKINLHAKALAATHSGNALQAIILLNAAIKRDGFSANYSLALGNAFRANAEPQKALVAYRAALQLAPDSIEVMNNLSVVLADLGRADEAIVQLQHALTINPESVELLTNLGNSLRELGDSAQSIAIFRQALSKDSSHVSAWIGLGMSYAAIKDADQSERCYLEAQKLDPQLAEAYDNLGVLYQDQGRTKDAIIAHTKAIEVAPSYAEAHKNLASALLLDGQLEAGWKEYEYRFKCSSISTQLRPFPYPCWNGEALNGKTLLIWGEQGIGDEVMFASFIPKLLLTTSAKIYLECEARLAPIFERSFPTITVLPRNPIPDAKLLGLKNCLQIPIGSLANFVPLNPAKPYLIADSQKVAALKTEYTSALGNIPLVGLSWRSNAKQNGRARSYSLKEFESLISNQSAHFISLQYGDINADVAELSHGARKNFSLDTEVNALNDLDSYAAQLAALDRIITIDNSTAHLAGALGVKTTVLLKGTPDWRWGLNTDTSLWYSNVKLLRNQENFQGVELP